MNRERFDVLERFTPLFDDPQLSFERFIQRRDRKRRRRHITAGVAGATASRRAGCDRADDPPARQRPEPA